jgi:hypothetical protein
MAFINIIGPQGRPLSFNPAQINYVHSKLDIMSVDLYGQGVKGGLSKDPTVIADFISQLLSLAYFLDLRTAGIGAVVNLLNIREVDYVANNQIINIYFNNTQSYITVGWEYKTILENALATFTPSSGGAGSGTAKTITQTAHGFVIGNVLRYDGHEYTKAIASADTTSEVIGIVSKIVDANTFILQSSGYLTGLSGLSAGSVYFLSDVVLGLMTLTEPTTFFHVSKPVFVADSDTGGYVQIERGMILVPANSGGTGGTGSGNGARWMKRRGI